MPLVELDKDTFVEADDVKSVKKVSYNKTDYARVRTENSEYDIKRPVREVAEQIDAAKRESFKQRQEILASALAENLGDVLRTVIEEQGLKQKKALKLQP